MEGAPRRGRNRLVSGAAEPRAAAAGGTQRALVSGLRAAGDRDACVARAGPGPAPVPCPRPAPGWPRKAVSRHSLAGQEEKKKKKKLANGTRLPFPPGCTSYRASDTLGTSGSFGIPPIHTSTSPKRGQKSPQGLRVSVLGRGSLPFPFPNAPSIRGHVQGAVQPPGQRGPSYGVLGDREMG